MNEYLMVLKKYAEFDGRARRREYWMFVLFNILISIAISIVESIFGIGSFLSAIYTLAVLLPGIGVSIRRLHDTDHRGWWLLICLVPIVGFIVLIVLMVKDSQVGENKYGSNPKQSATSAPVSAV